MEYDQTIREQLLQFLQGGNAHMTFEQSLDQFPLDQINQRLDAVPYTPWHLLEHMRIAQWDILEFIRNPDHVSPDWPREYWPDSTAQADSGAWQQTIERFLSDRRALEALVQDSSVELIAPLKHAHKYTILREILVVADHNAHHLGQFILFRKMLKD